MNADAPATRAGVPVRVLVAEDSLTARELLVAILTRDPGIEVVGVAANGAEAVELTARLRPSLVLMDIDMPVMDGLQATKRIMTDTPTPIIIVTATRHAADVEMSLEATRHGALALLPKPGWPGSSGGAAHGRLVSQVKALAAVRVIRHMSARADGGPAPACGPGGPQSPDAGRHVPIEIVAVAASTGGPHALARLLGRVPVHFPAPVLVVQHLPAGFAAGFATWLRSQCSIPVDLAADGVRLKGGSAYVAPDGVHLEVAGRRVQLRAGPPSAGMCPAANRLFGSLAGYGPRAAAVVLTGMGNDGLDGACELAAAGGRILAQDRATSVVFGMPGAVVAAGIAEFVAPVEALATRLVALSTAGAHS